MTVRPGDGPRQCTKFAVLSGVNNGSELIYLPRTAPVRVPVPATVTKFPRSPELCAQTSRERFQRSWARKSIRRKHFRVEKSYHVGLFDYIRCDYHIVREIGMRRICGGCRVRDDDDSKVLPPCMQARGVLIRRMQLSTMPWRSLSFQ